MSGTSAKVPAPSIRLLEDPDFPLGPGLFETIRLESGSPEFLEEHWMRISASCRKLGYPFPFQQADFLRALASGQASGATRMRLVYHLESGAPKLSIQFPEAKPLLERWILFPIIIEPHPLAAHKIIDRKIYEEWRQIAIDKGADDALLVSKDGQMLETTRANIFAVIDGTIHTPPANGKILPGIIRAQVAKQGKKCGQPVCERPLFKEDIEKADEVLVTNSLIGLLSVSEIAGWRVSAGGFRADVLVEKLRKISLGNVADHAIQDGRVLEK